MPKEQASTTLIPVAPSPHLLHRQTCTLIPQTLYHSHCHSPCKIHSLSAISYERFPPIPCSLSITRMLSFSHLLLSQSLEVGAQGSALLFIAASRSHGVTLTLNFCSIEVHGGQLYISLLLFTAVSCHLPGVPPS